MVEKAVFERMLPPVFGKERIHGNFTNTPDTGYWFFIFMADDKFFTIPIMIIIHNADLP